MKALMMTIFFIMILGLVKIYYPVPMPEERFKKEASATDEPVVAQYFLYFQKAAMRYANAHRQRAGDSGEPQGGGDVSMGQVLERLCSGTVADGTGGGDRESELAKEMQHEYPDWEYDPNDPETDLNKKRKRVKREFPHQMKEVDPCADLHWEQNKNVKAGDIWMSFDGTTLYVYTGDEIARTYNGGDKGSVEGIRKFVAWYNGGAKTFHAYTSSVKDEGANAVRGLLDKITQQQFLWTKLDYPKQRSYKLEKNEQNTPGGTGDDDTE